MPDQKLKNGTISRRAELAKLGLRDRVQVVVYAYERGLVRPGAG